MRLVYSCFLFIYCLSVKAQNNSFYKEKYRPQFHFTPPIHWMNDPNGLVYHKGEYHLFYQFNPFGNRWGHMSWGHAVSKDLLHWQHLPLAIPEEKDTMIFSGSCVTDVANSAGFATDKNQQPMVAIYTAHIEEKNQSQHIAYSLDDGRTWIKYNANPVLDLGKRDFRDPKVFWYAPHRKWVMVVVYPNEKEIKFYTSKNLKQWNLMSSFGPAGDTNGIWECPDLFEVPVKDQPGKTKWVLMHSPAPYMQYFIGEFDGEKFVNDNSNTKIYRPDYGPDYYAAITFNGLEKNQNPISIGWINNWNYANDIPTSPWKSAMSIPRKLCVKKITNEWVLIQQPVEQVKTLRQNEMTWKNITVTKNHRLPLNSQTLELEVEFTAAGETSGVRLAKDNDHFIEIGYDAKKQLLYIDRSKAGTAEFNPSFAKLSRYETSVAATTAKTIKLRIFFDKSIVEVFANEGEAVMTAQLFPTEAAGGIELFSTGEPAVFNVVKFYSLQSAR